MRRREREEGKREGVRYWHGMWALHARTLAAAHLPRYYLPIQAVGQRKEREGARKGGGWCGEPSLFKISRAGPGSLVVVPTPFWQESDK